MAKMDIKTPILLLHKQRVQKNIKKIKSKTNDKIRFRPHFKTHQSAQIGDWFRDQGLSAITVSSVKMAKYFARHGWSDITIAFLFNKPEAAEINRLARRTDLNILIESNDAIHLLADKCQKSLKFWLKIDTGYHRTGIPANDMEQIARLAYQIKRTEKHKFQGILTHSGHTYKAKSPHAVKTIYADTITKMTAIRDHLRSEGFYKTEISIGDTPSCSIIDKFTEIDEIRPGNFVFYDVMQFFLGSCNEDELAVALACPIVGKYPERNELVVYAGAIHLSKDCIEDPEGRKIFGLVSDFDQQDFGPILKHAYVSSLSQEHGIIRSKNPILQQKEVGDVVLIYPIHSCLTANLMRQYTTLEGEVIKTLNY